MSISSMLTIISSISSLVTIFLGFLYIFEHTKTQWRRGRQMLAAGISLIALIGIAVFAVRGKFAANKTDLVEFRDIASGAYDSKDYGTTIRLMSWAIRFNDDEESFYRTRARAYKRSGDYSKDLEDRMKVFKLNPGLERNQLFIIEDLILLKQNQNAEKWIREHQGSINGPDERTMFGFFNLVCTILDGRDYSSQEEAFRARISQYPLTQHFEEKFWKPDFLLLFLERNSLPETSKTEIEGLIQALQRTVT